METSASFGYWMRRQRKALDLTQQALADGVGYSVATLKKIEADERRPSREMAERLADYLAIPVDQRQQFIETARGLQSVDNMPLASAPLTLSSPHSNLPRPLTSFIGREKEIQQVESLVLKARLVTITGPGGVGKTRLAIQTAQAVIAQFKDGVWWVGLASLFETTLSKKRDPSHQRNLPYPLAQDDGVLMGVELVAQAVAKILRIPDSPGQPPLQGVLEHLYDKRLLVVLDNCEHLIEACAALAERLLSNCPQVTLLATSREALGVPGEKIWPLPSLSLPDQVLSADARTILRSEAVSLFVERTGDILPGYQPDEAEVPTIAKICLRLEGIPLAIELAAARMNLLSAQEIAARLDSRFSLLTGGRRTDLPRHQTLQAAIEWSYDLLNENERVLLRHLSVFAGSFTLEAAEAICASQEIRREEVLTLLGRLVDKSLLTVEPAPPDSDLATRYRFLDTVRSFGRLKLDEVGETRWVRDRHADYYVRLAETADPELLVQNQLRWFKLLQAENDNIRAVVEWSAESDQAESALRLVGALLWFWFSIGSSREGRDLAIQALAVPSATRFKEYRARALITAGYLQWVLGDIGSARENIEEALSILRTSDDEASLAWSMQILGLVLTTEGNYDLADVAMKDGVAISQKLGDYKSGVFSLAFQGDIALSQGNRSRAIKIYEDSATVLQTFGNKNFLAYPMRRLGYLALEQNDISLAQDYFCQSLSLNRGVGDKRGVAACLISMAALAIHLDKPIHSARLYGVVERWLESLSFLLYLDQAELGRIRSQLPTYLDEATFTTAFNQGWEMSEEQAIGLVEEILGGDE